MPKIVRVAADGDMIGVHLDNGSILMLELEPLLDRLGFGILREDGRALYPKTDGEHVYWQDGPRLGLGEIRVLMFAGKDNN